MARVTFVVCAAETIYQQLIPRWNFRPLLAMCLFVVIQRSWECCSLEVDHCWLQLKISATRLYVSCEKHCLKRLPKLPLSLRHFLNDRKHGVKSTRQGIKPLKIIITVLINRQSYKDIKEKISFTHECALNFYQPNFTNAIWTFI